MEAVNQFPVGADPKNPPYGSAQYNTKIPASNQERATRTPKSVADLRPNGSAQDACRRTNAQTAYQKSA